MKIRLLLPVRKIVKLRKALIFIAIIFICILYHKLIKKSSKSHVSYKKSNKIAMLNVTKITCNAIDTGFHYLTRSINLPEVNTRLSFYLISKYSASDIKFLWNTERISNDIMKLINLNLVSYSMQVIFTPKKSNWSKSELIAIQQDWEMNANKFVFSNLVFEAKDCIPKKLSPTVCSLKSQICAGNDFDLESTKQMFSSATQFKVNQLLNLTFDKLSRISSEYKISQMKSLINPEFDSYLDFRLSPANLCKSRKKFIFVYVLSSVKGFERRQLIRSTWANFSNLRVGFLIGKSNEPIYEKMVQIEQEKYDDLIQGNFTDNYRTLSYKSIMAWKWIATNCNKMLIRFIIKIDDDTMLNSIYLNKLLVQFNFQIFQNSFFCTVFTGFKPDKNIKSKYYVKDIEYNAKLYGIEHYSDYCFGPSYLMTTDVAWKLYIKAFEIKTFWMDDVNVGIIARYADTKFRNYNKNWYFDNTVKERLYYEDNTLRTNYSNLDLSNKLFVRYVDSAADFKAIWTAISTRK